MQIHEVVWKASRRLIRDSARSNYENLFNGDKPGMAFTDSEEKPYEIYIGTNYGFKVNIIRYDFCFYYSNLFKFTLLHYSTHCLLISILFYTHTYALFLFIPSSRSSLILLYPYLILKHFHLFRHLLNFDIIS